MVNSEIIIKNSQHKKERGRFIMKPTIKIYNCSISKLIILRVIVGQSWKFFTLEKI
jgi:hypothetical protein